MRSVRFSLWSNASGAEFLGGNSFPESTLRGFLYSAVCYHSCCCTSERMADAGHAPGCPAHEIFEAGDPDGVGRPYALLLENAGTPDEPLVFRLFLYAAAARYLDSVLHAVSESMAYGLGERRIPIGRIEATDAITGSCLLVADGKSEPLFCMAGPPAQIKVPRFSVAAGFRTMLLETVSPVSFAKPEGNASASVDAGTLCDAVLRRLAALGGGEPAGFVASPTSLVHTLSAVRDERVRYSRSSSRPMPVHGWKGVWLIRTNLSAASIGALAEVLALLPVGGRTTFGFGSVRVHLVAPGGTQATR